MNRVADRAVHFQRKLSVRDVCKVTPMSEVAVSSWLRRRLTVTLSDTAPSCNWDVQGDCRIGLHGDAFARVFFQARALDSNAVATRRQGWPKNRVLRHWSRS